MKITSNSAQPFLFKHNKERFILKPKLIVQEAPDWMMENEHALKLKEEEKISFTVKKKLTAFEQLKVEATKIGVVYGDGVKMAALETMVETKQKELDNAKK